MKQIVKIMTTVAAVLFLATTSISAQSSVGLRGGVTFGNFPNLPLDVPGGGEIDASGMWGNYGAVSFEIGVTRWFALQPEVTHLQKAGKIRLANSGNASLNVKMDYLEMPLLAKFRFGSGRLSTYAAFGPSVGYALNGRTQFGTNDGNFTEKVRFDNNYEDDGQRDNRFDIGGVLAFGLQCKVGIGSIVLDARAALDVNDYAKPSGNRAAYGLDTNHWEGIAMSIGYQIPLGRR